MDQVQANDDQEIAEFGEQEGRQPSSGKKDRDPINQGFFTTINLLNNYGQVHIQLFSCLDNGGLHSCLLHRCTVFDRQCLLHVHVCCIVVHVKDATNMNRYFHVCCIVCCRTAPVAQLDDTLTMAKMGYFKMAKMGA